MKRTFLAPLAVLTGIVGSVLLMAKSELFTPIIQFIHSGSIRPLQAVLCLLFTGAGFAVCYYLLNILCSYYVPRMGTDIGSSGVIRQNKVHGGDRKH